MKYALILLTGIAFYASNCFGQAVPTCNFSGSPKDVRDGNFKGKTATFTGCEPKKKEKDEPDPMGTFSGTFSAGMFASGKVDLVLKKIAWGCGCTIEIVTQKHFLGDEGIFKVTGKQSQCLKFQADLAEYLNSQK